MNDTPPVGQRQRRDRLIRERVHDPYKTRLKLHEPSVCPDCGAVYRQGRWQWAERPKQAEEARCQACHRIADDYPAGTVTVEGGFVAGHRDEIESLIRHTEKLEKGEHPLHRIMAVEGTDNDLLVKTTDIHLPRRIGEALESAYQGDLDFHYEEEAYNIRVHWRRDS